MAGDTTNIWNDIELRIDSDAFLTLCQISSMNKNQIFKNPLKPRAPFKWVFMDVITATAPKSLTSETTFLNYILIVDAYSRINFLMVWIELTQK